MSSKKADILLIISAFIGGMGFIGMKYLIENSYCTFQTIFGRFFVASIFMIIVFSKKIKYINIDDIKGGIITGFFLFGLFLFMVIGLKYTSASVNAFLTNISSVIVPFISWIFLKNRPKFYSFIAGFITVIGVWFMSFEGSFDFGFGAFMSLIASVSFAFQIILVEKFVKNADPIKLAVVENITVCILSFVVSISLKEKVPNIKIFDISVFLMLGMFCTGIYFLVQSICQKYTSSSKVGVILCSEAVFTAIVSSVLMNENMGVMSIIGCLLIFLGIVIAETGFSFFINKAID